MRERLESAKEGLIQAYNEFPDVLDWERALHSFAESMQWIGSSIVGGFVLYVTVNATNQFLLLGFFLFAVGFGTMINYSLEMIREQHGLDERGAAMMEGQDD